VLAEMVARGALVLVHPDGTAEWLSPRPGAFDGVRALDGAWLEAALEAVPIEVTYQHGVDEVLAALAARRAAAAVLIRPVAIGEIERTAREGLLMPPKSTFFTPKLRTGFVIRDLTTG
jgi:ABC-type amino acid transport substrate-binding protein